MRDDREHFVSRARCTPRRGVEPRVLECERRRERVALHERPHLRGEPTAVLHIDQRESADRPIAHDERHDVQAARSNRSPEDDSLGVLLGPGQPVFIHTLHELRASAPQTSTTGDGESRPRNPPRADSRAAAPYPTSERPGESCIFTIDDARIAEHRIAAADRVENRLLLQGPREASARLRSSDRYP